MYFARRGSPLDLSHLLRTPAAAAGRGRLRRSAAGAVRLGFQPSPWVAAAADQPSGEAAPARPGGLAGRPVAGPREVPGCRAARTGDGGHRGGGRRAGQVQRLPVPAVWADLRDVQAGAGQVRPRSIRARSSTSPRITRSIPSATGWRPSGGHMASCEAAVVGAPGARKGQGRRDGELAVRQPAHLDPGRGEGRPRAWWGGVADFDTRYASVLQLVKGDIEQGGPVAGAGHPDLLPERHPAAGAAARIPRCGHRHGAEASRGGGPLGSAASSRQSWPPARRRSAGAPMPISSAHAEQGVRAAAELQEALAIVPPPRLLTCWRSTSTASPRTT